jgi:hypothetical protein
MWVMHFKRKHLLTYLSLTLLVGTFSFVYLSFVPGVFNFWMAYAFVIPLTAMMIEILWYKKRSTISGWIAFRLGSATLVVQFILKGIYQIALTGFALEWLFIILVVLLFGYSLQQSIKE